MKTTLTLLAAVLLVCSGATFAQTPDGMPPSLETVCDTESGAAFGWCNAYCEAMDCELANDNDPLTEPHASANACDKVRTKFQQSTGRDMPCERSCPCSDPQIASYFASFIAGTSEFDADFCFTEPGLITDGAYIVDASIDVPVAFSVELAVDGQWICGLTSDAEALPITPEQGMYCAELIEQAANQQGLTCGPPPV